MSKLRTNGRRSRRSSWGSCLWLGLLGLFVFDASQAATFRVPSESPTIQAAIDSAAVNDTVQVAPGTYRGDGNRDLNFHGKDLVVYSEGGAAATILDVEGNIDAPHRGVTFDSGETRAALFQGFTIVNGFKAAQPSLRGGRADPRHDLSAGGILVQYSSPVLRDLVISRCQSDYAGGGVEIELNSEALVENVRIEGCVSNQIGGGLSVERLAAPELINVVVVGNFAPDGGGVSVGPAHPVFRGLLIAGNAAFSRGGGLFCTGFAQVELERATIWNNCGGRGAEIFAEAASPVLARCSVVDSSQVEFDLTGAVEFDQACRFVDPRFCAPVDCANAPTIEGDYRVASASICLPEHSACGEVIGVLGLGPCGISPIERTTWGLLKARYGGAGRRATN
ncbi:MAG: right-handed parallel beta-helix repeat-containing protein [Candidatus Eisenbacteria bacterium]